MSRLLSSFFFAASFVLFGLAGYCYFSAPAGPGLEIAATDIEVADCRAGQETEVVIALQNNSSRPMRVLGLSPC